jgi:hypothetical protein
MKIKQILVALFFTVLIVSCGKENTKEADAKKEIIKKEGPKEAGTRAGKIICEKMKAGTISPADISGLTQKGIGYDSMEDMTLWYEGYTKATKDCL